MEATRPQGEREGYPPVRAEGHGLTGGPRRRIGRSALAAAALLGGALLMLPHGGRAQGNAVVILRQMQARIAQLSSMLQQQQQTVQRQQQTIQRLNRDRTTDNTRLQQLQNAITAAANAGDPLARAARAPAAALTLQKLATQFQNRARSQPATAVAAASSTDTDVPDLSGAQLHGAVLRGVRLSKANLTGADLTNADLSKATLTGATLKGTKLQGATLTGADLTNADLKGALYDAHTHWPVGFDPQPRGALLVQ